MTDNRRYNHFVIFALILIMGLGLALALPWLANAQGLAAQSGVPAQDNAPDSSHIHYVAITGTGTGVSWTEAFTNVQDALGAALAGDEIWVAKGVYYPDVGIGQINDSVTATFLMTDGVSLYGGFDTSDAVLTDRDWENNVTVLSGDIDGNDIKDSNGVVITTTNIISDNAYHVVTARGVTETAVLDGFTITAGHANREGASDAHGGGILCFDGCNIRLNHVSFSGNKAKSLGGAMYIYAYEDDNYPSLRNVTFYGNSALNGGAIYSKASLYGSNTLNLVNATFSKNVANFGGAISQYGFSKAFSKSTVIVRNATFSKNLAGGLGGAIYNAYTTHTDVVNSILWNNQDSSGRGTLSSSIYMIPKDPWFYRGSTYVENSLIQGTGGSRNWPSDDRFTDGGGNIDTNPLFVKDPNLSTASNAAGNLRLQAKSPVIDAGDNTFVSGVPTDLDGEPRIQDGDGDGVGTVDMGAYEAKAKTERHYILSVFRTGPKDSRVLSSPAGIDCGDTCSLLLKQDSTLTLAAIPDDYNKFTGWDGACSGIGDCVVVMDSAKSVTANFDYVYNFPIIFR